MSRTSLAPRGSPAPSPRPEAAGSRARGRRSALLITADRASIELSRKLGRMLRDGRLSQRLTQAQAARRAGIAQSTWSWLESGAGGGATIAT